MRLNKTQIFINRFLTVLVVLSLVIFIITFINRQPKIESEVEKPIANTTYEIKPYNGSYYVLDKLYGNDNKVAPNNNIRPIIITYDDLGVSKDEFWNLVYITFTESNNQSDIGQQLVVHVILNRVGDSRFADSIKGVIEQPSQFCGRWVNTCGNYTERNVDNVVEVLYNRSTGNVSEIESSVMFFHNHNIVASRSYARRFGLTKVVKEEDHTFLK